MAASSSNIHIFPDARDFRIDQQTINIWGNAGSTERRDLILRLNPITDASHTRNRRTSPPDSACFPGTRKKVIRRITIGVDTGMIGLPPSMVPYRARIAHVYWFHGFAGSGKSAISLEIAKIYAGSGRLLASYFFFRNAGDRSGMSRFAVTLASQLAAAVPTTTSSIQAAIDAEPGLLTPSVSLTTQMERLVYEPFRAAVERGDIANTLVEGPFVVVIDGLDECDDKQGVMEFIDHLLDYFKRHPSIPLRFFIASRVEEHIRTRLENGGVLMDSLDSHSADEDIEMFLQASFQAASVDDRVVQAYVRAHGEWPTKSLMNQLLKHIRGSFVLASTILRFIVQPATENDPSTPMERLLLTLKINGLDSLYAQTLSRSQHLPRFRDIISTIAFLRKPLPIVGLADLLGIETFEIVHVLLNLQAIVHVPGTDEEDEVTVCHTSLRDFLTEESRSGEFFAPPSFNLYLSYHAFSSFFEKSDGPAHDYGKGFLSRHWGSFVRSNACDFIKEVEQFKARQPLRIDGIPYSAFLCTVFFSSISLRTFDDLLYALAESANQLALTVECPGHRIRLWLQEHFIFVLPHFGLSTVQVNEETFETLKHGLQRASNAIRANFPGIPGLEVHQSKQKSEYRLPSVVPKVKLSGISIFNALGWTVARAQFKWEEANITPRRPLRLNIDTRTSTYDAHFKTFVLSFDSKYQAAATPSDPK